MNIARICPMCTKPGKYGAKCEDALPEWVRREFKGSGPFLNVNAGRWDPLPRRLKTRLICNECNQWMGRTFEQSGIKDLLTPLIHGEPCELSEAEQCCIASWAHKTLVMLHLYMYREMGSKKIGPELVRLRNEIHPPVGSYVGLGCFSNPANADQQTALGVNATVGKEDPEIPHPQSPLARLEGKAIVGVSKGLLLATPVVVHHFSMEAQPVAEFGSWAEDNGFITRIWPPNGQPIHWPLPKKFGSQTFREFGSLFRYI